MKNIISATLIIFPFIFISSASAELVQFQSNTPAKASEVNSNFQQLQERIEALETVIFNSGITVSGEAVYNGVWSITYSNFNLTCASNGVTYSSPGITDTVQITYDPNNGLRFLHFGTYNNINTSCNVSVSSTGSGVCGNVSYSIFDSEKIVLNLMTVYQFNPSDVNTILGTVTYRENNSNSISSCIGAGDVSLTRL